MSQDAYDLDYRYSAAEAVAAERATFVRRVYMHLAGAILALIGIEFLLVTGLNVEQHKQILMAMYGSPWSWLIVLLAFMGASYLAQTWAQSRTSPAMQYLGLGLYVCVWAVIMLPLLLVAHYLPVNNGANVIAQAGILTGALFGGLTLAVFVTRQDFSFLGPVICIGSLIALGVILAGILFGFTLGLFFCFAMVALVSASILYNTSNVMLHYPTDMYVAASLELFADVAMLFMYILRILMLSNNRD